MQVGFHVMDPRRDCVKLSCILVLYISIAASIFTQCDARRSRQLFKFEGPTHPIISNIKPTKKLKVLNHFDLGIDSPVDPSGPQSYGVSSPFSLPPFDSLAPIPLPQDTPPFCENPPLTPQPPSTINPGPIIYSQPPPPPPFYFTPINPIQSPPPNTPSIAPSPPEYNPTPFPPIYFPSPPSNVPNPPEYVPSPPTYVPSPPELVPNPPTYVPSPPEVVPNPPIYVPSPPKTTPNPPQYGPSPPEYVPSPGGFVPSPPVFQPPVVFPPPNVPPSPHSGTGLPLWCVVKPSVPDPIIEEAMNYACGSGADCGSIQPQGSCYQPDTLIAHASFAFNSYWQRTKAAGGTCDFGGTAILVTVDPSFDGCHFVYY